MCLAGALLLVAPLAGCDDDGTRPLGPDSAGVRVSADLTASAVASVDVEVAVDTAAPEVVTIPVDAGAISQCVSVPLDVSIDVTLRARDAGGTETHSGTLALTLQEGERVMHTLTLDSVIAGGSAIEAILHSVALSVTPQEDTLAVGERLTLSAPLLDCEGAAVSGVRLWGTSDPTVAEVSAAGVVTGVDAGSARITVHHELLADTAEIHVVPAMHVALQLVENGLTAPVFVTAPSGDTSRLFVVQQNGVIRILEADTLLPQAFLDIRTLVTFGGERGLLGMAFHRQYETNGFFFVNYTNTNGDTRVVRYHVSANPNVADPGSGDTILSVDQPFSNHNAGMLAFGPDGMLYIGLGDGGSGGDPEERAQNLSELLGKMLRINVDGAPPYTIPPDNPFVDSAGARGEIWAYGLRNPWRYSFDRQTGDLYIGDVGQNAWEEVSVQPGTSAGGENYGWDIMEGLHCHEPPQGCPIQGLTMPLIEYANDASTCSVTGGYVYRGTRVTALSGHYLYADFCAGFVRSFRYAGGAATDERDWTDQLSGLSQVSSFGEDGNGELYITTLNGNVYRMVPAGP